MSKIKTRETVKSIKVLDKAAIASERIRQAAIRAKEKVSSITDDSNGSGDEYAQNEMQHGAEDMSREVTHRAVSDVKKSAKKVKEIADNRKAENPSYQERGRKYASDSAKKGRAVRQKQKQTFVSKSQEENAPKSQPIKTPQWDIKQSKRDASKSTIKTVPTTKQPVDRSIKTAQRTEKVSVKTAETAAKTAEKTAKASKQAARRIQIAAKKAEKTAKAAAKSVATAIKAIMQGTKSLVAAIAAGGTTAVIVVVVILLIALLLGSCFGIFFSSEEKSDGSERMCNVVREINAEFDGKIESIKSSVSYDELLLSGSHATWQDILAVYAVKTANDSENAMEVATVSDVKKNLLRDIFWDMTEIEYETESVTTGTGDDAVTTVYLDITVSCKTADEIAAEYSFDDERMSQLNELTDEQYRPQWMSVIYGIKPNSSGNSEIVAVALSQIGNIGGEPYWFWYGFPSRVEWCACFVSWCANECGYIESGAMPKYAYCPFGVDWFQSRGQWLDGDEAPEPGMIIFFDWDNRGSSGPQDGIADHTGIVEKMEDGYVYTVEGNSSDGCRERQYQIGNYEILGYGIIG